MSDTFRIDPKTFDEVPERNYLKRKKREEKARKKPSLEYTPDDCYTEEDERDDQSPL